MERGKFWEHGIPFPTVSRGDAVIIAPEMKHAIQDITRIYIIEVQIGDELTEEDI